MPKAAQSIAELAYALWQQRGSPHGSAERDWFEAMRQLDTLPAGDPPPSSLPDVPPVDAKKKIRAAKTTVKKAPSSR